MLHKNRFNFGLNTLLVVLGVSALIMSGSRALAQDDLAPEKTYLPIIQQQSDGSDGENESPTSVEGEHSENDYVLAEQARKRNEPRFEVTEEQTRATGPLNQVGQWGPVRSWPFAFASAANLPDGRIAVWGANNLRSFNGGNFTYSSIWDPETDQLLSRNHNDHSMFCAIPTLLEDGRVFANGGDGNSPKTSIFDYRTNQWNRVENQNTGRWYPGSLVLPGDKVFTMLGQPGGPYPEVWEEGSGWSLLTGANLNNGVLNFSGYQSTWLPYLHLMPDGNVFHSGPTAQMNIINPTGNGSISSAGLSNTWYPKYGSAVMYDEGKILFAGGGTNGASTNQAFTLDFNGPTPTKANTSPMNNNRKFNNGVMLPTGEVIMIGGNTSGNEFSDSGTILEAEIWNPTTETWRSVANMSVPRNYHAVALLMTDGRVWSGGGGLCNCTADHPDHQVYSPPYLFNADGSLATRPTINSAPDSAGYGATLNVQATNGIQRFTMVKMSGVTHNLNSDQRFLNVDFTTPSSGNYSLTLNSNVNVLTPGHWMLFALDNQGVPSEAHVIQVQNISPTINIESPGDQTTFKGANVNQPLVFTNPNNGVLTFSATGLPTGLNINNTSGVISGSPTAAGTFNVTVSVTDGNDSDNATFNWTVIEAGSIRYVRLIADSEVNGNPWTSAAEFNVLDSNGNPIDRTGWTITADSEELAGESGNAENAIDGNPNTIWHTQWQTANPVHPHQITIDMQSGYLVTGFRYLPRQTGFNGTIANYRFFVSSDGLNWGAPVAQGTLATSQAEKTVTFSVPEPNQPPTLTNPGNLNDAVGSTIAQPINANDPDGDTLTFSASGLPAGLAINSSTGLISGSLSNAGNNNVTVNVTDGNGGSDSISFVWTIYDGLALNSISTNPQQMGTPATYTASFAGGSNPRFKWLYGDGTPETNYASSPINSHTFSQPGRYLITLTATDDSGTEVSTQFSQLVYRQLTNSRPAVSMSIVYEERAGNDRVWNVNPDNNTVTVSDAVSRQKLSEINVGDNPRALAIAPNGNIWVTNKDNATISIIDASSLNVIQTVNVSPGSQPHGILFAPNGNDAYVALEAVGRLVKLNPVTGAQRGTVDVGPNPRHLSMLQDSSRVFVSRFITPLVPGEETGNPNFAAGGGEVVVVFAGNMSVTDTITLEHSTRPDTEGNGRGIPNYLGPAVISPDGSAAWVPSKQDNIARGTLRDGENLDFDHSVRSIASYIDLGTNQETFVNRVDFDNGGIASSGQFGRYGAYLFVALEGSREVAVVDAYARTELFRIDVEIAPQGIVVSADGQTLFVHNFIGRSISIVDIAPLLTTNQNAATFLTTIDTVANETLSAQVLTGKEFFYDAKDTRLALDGYMSCASCHNAGDSDGRVWDFTGMGEGLRNTISLQGHADQGPLHWTANFDEVHDFEAQIRSFAQGTGLMSNSDFNATQDPLGAPKAGLSPDLDAMAAYVNSLTAVTDSPYRQANGSLTTEGEAGKQIFVAQSCATCHTGDEFTDSAPGVMHNVGTLKSSSGQRLDGPLNALDTPTLRGLWMTAPYLHDGSAPTLAEAVNAHSGINLTGSDITNLVAYLNQIDEREPAPSAPPPTTGTGQITWEYWNTTWGSDLATLRNEPSFPDNPANSGTLTSFEAPSDRADLFGQRISGYLYPPVSGNYTFWIASDDQGELWLSSDDQASNISQIASVPGWTSSREWDRYPAQQSTTISLQAGQAYYIEALAQEGGGGDNLAVAWQIPGDSRVVIAGQYLAPVAGGTDPTNNPPTLTSPGNQANEIGDSVLLQLTATDADNDPLTFSSPGLPAGLNLNASSGLISGSPTTEGSINVNVSVNDGNGGLDSVSFLWTITSGGPGNSDPVLTNPANQTNEVGDTVSLQLSASDADNDTLTYAATGLPAGLSINANSGLISGSPTTAVATNVAVSVSDGNGGTDSANFVWTVSEPPPPPPGSGTGVILWETWNTTWGSELDVLRSDSNFPDNPATSNLLTAFEAPIDRADIFGQRVSGYIYPPVTGNYTFWIASDNQGELWLSADDQASNISQIAEVTDWTDSREWTKYPGQQSATITLQAGEVYYIEALAQESAGGDNLAVAWQIPGGSREIIDGQYLSPADNGTNPPPPPPPVNSDPVLTSPGNQTSTVGDSVSLTLQASDADNDSLTFSANQLPAGLSLNTGNGQISGSPTTAGTTNVTITVNDGEGGSDSVSFSWTINEPAPPPPPPPGGGTGEIRLETWNTSWGTTLSVLRATTSFPGSPDSTQTLTEFQAPIDRGDIFGQRISGFIYPPVSGQYTFWIASDDQGELWLSTSESRNDIVLLATVTGWTDPREWDKDPAQESVTVTLQAGQAYYIEALAQEGGGGDHLAVAWQIPGQARAVIDGQYLAPVD